MVIPGTGLPVPGITITLSGSYNERLTTDSTGRYSFPVPQGGNYTITPSKNNDITTNNGITPIDILKIRRHILGNQLLGSPYKIIAADVNADSSVTTTDVLLIREMILQNITVFPNNRLWSFVPSDYIFPDQHNPFPFSSQRTYTNLQQSLTSQDFIGIKLGDVNNSCDASIP
jgi:hypothetical protein